MCDVYKEYDRSADFNKLRIATQAFQAVRSYVANVSIDLKI